jgi:transcriptional regulator with XRE-family HTH domain
MLLFDDAARIRIIRALLGVNMRQFAEMVDVTPATVANWEKGRTFPQADKRLWLASKYRELGIGFLPSGMPVPAADLPIFSRAAKK